MKRAIDFGTAEAVLKTQNEIKDALGAAIKSGHTDIVRLLIGMPVFQGFSRLYAGFLLISAAKNGYVDIVQILMEITGTTFNWQVESALEHAAKNGYADIVRLLLDMRRGGLINRIGCILNRAVENGHYDVVKLLLDEPGIVLNWQIVSSLGYVVTNRHRSVLKLLLATSNMELSDKVQKSLTKYLIYLKDYMGIDDLLEYTSSSERFNQFYDRVISSCRNTAGYRFLLNVLINLEFLLGNVKYGGDENPPGRMSLLVARVCGVVFGEAVTVKFSDMSMPKFILVSHIMKSSKIVNLLGSYNPYWFIHELLVHGAASSGLSKLPFVIRMHISGFLVADDLGGNIKELISRDKVAPSILSSGSGEMLVAPAGAGSYPLKLPRR